MTARDREREDVGVEAEEGAGERPEEDAEQDLVVAGGEPARRPRR